MKRAATLAALIAVVALLTPALSADVKTTEKTLIKFEGLLGMGASMFGPSATRDGIVSTVALKGMRKSTINEMSGTIADLAEQKQYILDVKRKQYTVMTFDQLRQQMADMRAQQQKRAAQMKKDEKPQKSNVEMETEFDVKESGQRKQIAGYDAREVVMTVTTHEKGRKLEDSGGSVMTIHNWLGPKVPALEELTDFDMKFTKAVYGDAVAMDMQMGQAAAMYPSMATMQQRLLAEGGKLQGTSLSSVTTFEAVQSAEEWKSSSEQQQRNSAANNSGANGLGGFLAGRMGANGPAQQRMTIMTTTRDLLTIAKTATDADVAIPAGYKEKK